MHLREFVLCPHEHTPFQPGHVLSPYFFAPLLFPQPASYCLSQTASYTLLTPPCLSSRFLPCGGNHVVYRLRRSHWCFSPCNAGTGALLRTPNLSFLWCIEKSFSLHHRMEHPVLHHIEWPPVSVLPFMTVP